MNGNKIDRLHVHDIMCALMLIGFSLFAHEITHLVINNNIHVEIITNRCVETGVCVSVMTT